MALHAQTALLRPADPRAFAVLIQKILDFAVTFGKASLSPGQASAAITTYREHLGDLPADLLERAIDEAVAAWVYPGLPTPGEIRKRVSEEFSGRLVEKSHLEMVLRRLPAPKPQGPTRDTSAVLAKVGRHLSARDLERHIAERQPQATPSAQSAPQPCRRGLPPLAEFVRKQDEPKRKASA